MTPLGHHQLCAGSTIGRRIAAGAVVAGLGLAVGLPPAIAQDRPAESQVLTERFPLDAVETAPRAPAVPDAGEPAAPPAEQSASPPDPAGDSSSDGVILILIITGVALLAGVVGAHGLRRRWVRNSEPPIPPRRRSRAPDGRAGAAAMEARVRPRDGDPGIDAVNARISPSEVPPVSHPDVVPIAPRPAPAPPAPPAAAAPPAPAEPPRAEPPRTEPSEPAPDITLVEAAPGAPAPRPRLHDDDAEPPEPEITLIGAANGAAGRHDALPGLGDEIEPPPRPSLDELPDITPLVEPPPPAAAPPPSPDPARRVVDPGSAALAARIRPDEAQLDAAARALRSRTPPREEPVEPKVFWAARARAQAELKAAAGAASGATPPPPEPRDERAAEPAPVPSLPSSVREIATPRRPPAAAAVPVAVIHGFRSALRAFRAGGPREHDGDHDR